MEASRVIYEEELTKCWSNLSSGIYRLIVALEGNTIEQSEHIFPSHASSFGDEPSKQFLHGIET